MPEPAFTPEGAHRLNPDEVATLAALFADPTLTGGQVPPRLGKWVNADNFIFVQLDDLEAPTAVRYFGVGSVGTFCAETQPSTDFTHYHRFHAPEYREGHAGDPGEEDGFGSSGSRPIRSRPAMAGRSCRGSTASSPPPRRRSAGRSRYPHRRSSASASVIAT